MIPATFRDRRYPASLTLCAANGTNIRTFGERSLKVDLGLRRAFEWSFIKSEVKCAIIGTDFLYQFGLIVDVRNRRLLDGVTRLSVPGRPCQKQTITIRRVVNANQWHGILDKFPSLTRTTLAQAEIKHSVVHFIETTGPPLTARARRLHPDKLKAAKAEFDFMVRQGLCRPSRSPWATPLHLQPKKEGSWRPCGDYRRLNNVTIPDRYPIPFLQDATAFLYEATVFTTLDLVRAFQQIPVRPQDIPKTAIITPFGLFEFPYMTFGLRNAAQTFQRFINEVTAGLSFCFAYIDDLLIASKSEEEHKAHLEAVFNRLEKYGLVINKDKCVFAQKEVSFLGHTVSAKGLKPLSSKVKAIEELQQPGDVQGLRRFLGMANFYNRFLPRAAITQVPLQAAVAGKKRRSKEKLVWTPEMISAFKDLKKGLSDAAMLAFPAPGAELSLQTDASDVAVGAVLQQRIRGAWQPLSYFSRKLTATERNYSTYDRELLGIFKAVKHFRHAVEGREFHVLTDHKPLLQAFSKSAEMSSPRQIRQLAYISEFSTDIRHVAGHDNPVADVLSRIETIAFPLRMETEEIAAAQAEDQELPLLLNSSSTSLQLQKFLLSGSSSVIYCDVSGGTIRTYVPRVLRERIFQLAHSLSHPSARITRHTIAQQFVWPSMNKDITQWCKMCLPCQRSKVQRHTKLLPEKIPVPDRRFEHIHLDLVGPLPPSRGARYLITMVDRFTRWPEAIPVADATADTVARAVFSHWVARFGAPRFITTDRGSQFEAALFAALVKLLGSTRCRTTAYHPAANGMVERWHRALKAALMCQENREWVDILPTVLLGLRTCLKEDLKGSAAEMVYGSTLKVPAEFFDSEELDANPQVFLEEFRRIMRRLRPKPTAHHIKGQLFNYKDLYSCTHVFLRQGMTKRPLDQPYQGPYRIIERLSDRVFAIEVNGGVSHVSVERLKPAYMAVELPEEHETQPSTSKQDAEPKTYARKPIAKKNVRFDLSQT